MSTLRLFRGDTGVWDFTCVDEDGEPLDLAGATAIFTVKEEVHDIASLIEKQIGSGITVTDSPGGILQLRVLPEDTDDLPATRTYHWDLQISYGANDIFTVDTGLFLLNADITR